MSNGFYLLVDLVFSALGERSSCFNSILFIQEILQIKSLIIYLNFLLTKYKFTPSKYYAGFSCIIVANIKWNQATNNLCTTMKF